MRIDWTHFSTSRDVPGVGRQLATVSDAELLRRGNADAFAAVYDRYAEAMFAWSRARVGDYAADLTAEVFARAWLSRRRFRDEADGSAAPWLYGIANNVLRDSLRKRRVEDVARCRLGLPRAVATDPAYEDVEQRASLPEAALQAIANLAQSEKEVLRLRVVEERSYRDIAERLDCTAVAARLRVSRALRRLQLTLGGQP
jgi:RNA polymerase sigma-70 factor (ECF subfamily)